MDPYSENASFEDIEAFYIAEALLEDAEELDDDAEL
jgi:hypothetical protein